MNPIKIFKTLYIYSKAEGTEWLFISYAILLTICFAFLIYNMVKDLF